MNLPNGLAGPPDLEVTDLLHLSLILLTVVGLGVEVEGALGLLASLDGVIELAEDGLQGVLEAAAPIDGAAAGGGRACLVHPVHAIGTDQRVQALRGLLNGLVKGLAWAVALLTQDLVLRKEHAVDAAHEATALAVQVRVDLLLEGRLVEVSAADAHTQRNGLLLSLACHILVDGDGGVNATALTEKRAHGAAGAFWGDEDDVDIGRHVDLGLLLKDRGEAVREVEGLLSLAMVANASCKARALIEKIFKTYLALGDLGLQGGPGLALGSITKQVHDNSTPRDGLINLEEVLARHPAILLGVLPRLAVLPHADDDIEAIVTHVEGLGMALRAVADDGHSVILEVFLQAGDQL
jgi:hypothetical protein